MIDSEKLIFIAGMLLGIGLGALWWHPYFNSDYVGKEDYDALLMENQKLMEENTQLKQNMADLIKEFYAKKTLSDIIGIGKYRALFCALQSYLNKQIPVIGELVC